MLESSIRDQLIEVATITMKILGTVFHTKHITCRKNKF